MHSNEEIINGCINKDKYFEDLLYKKYAAIAYAICLRYVSNTDDAKDVFQEAFVKVYGQLKNYKMQGSFEGWIKRIFVNTALDYCRRRRRVVFVSVDDYSVSTTELVAELETNIPKEKLMELIMQLPDGYRIVFNLYAIENYTHKQIAELLNIEEGTSKSQLFKARKVLQLQLRKIMINQMNQHEE
jgi:RNA polymerase sigma-70 factor (ECF subfamily)